MKSIKQVIDKMMAREARRDFLHDFGVSRNTEKVEIN